MEHSNGLDKKINDFFKLKEIDFKNIDTGIFYVSRDSMVNKINAQFEEDSYKQTIQLLKTFVDDSNYWINWGMKTDEVLVLEVYKK